MARTKEQRKAYYIKNKEKAIKEAKIWKAAHPEIVKRGAASYRIRMAHIINARKNIPRTCQYCGAEFLAYKGDVAKGWGKFCKRQCLYDSQRVNRESEEWKLEHFKKHKAAKVKWRVSNPERYKRIIKGWNMRKYSAKMKLPGSHTLQEWEDLCAKFHHRCVCCGNTGKLTRDHIIPITAPGSSDFIENIQPLCKSCNSRKQNRQSFDYRKTPFTRSGQAVLFG